MTNREFYNVIVNGTAKVSYKNEDGNINYKDVTIDSPEIKAFAEDAIAKLDEKNAKRKNTPTSKQVANDAIKAKIVEAFNEGGKEFVATSKTIAEKFEISTQKASALLRQIAATGVIAGERPKASAPIEYKLV